MPITVKFLKAILVLLIVAVLISINNEGALGQSTNDFKITIVDPKNCLGRDREILKSDLIAALRDWAQYLRGVSTLDYELRVLDQTGSGAVGGRSACAVETSYNGERVLEEGAAYKMRTGNDTNGAAPDVIITVKANAPHVWLDPQPFQGTLPVPVNKIDAVTTLAHELGQAFGFNGRRDLATGNLRPGDLPSLFDAHMINPTSTSPAFRGSATYAVYGADLPITYFSDRSENLSFICNGRQYDATGSKSQNFYHYGRFKIPNESPLSLFGLMSGVWAYPNPLQGLRLPVGKLDVAVLRDLGAPVR